MAIVCCRLITMSEYDKPPYCLVPETALLEPLPKHLRVRFLTALELMRNHLQDALSWEIIATRSAISPFHFHRQFSKLFLETPGQYLSRIRLQNAVSYLLQNDKYSVTDIAVRCGYSSSQALGKVLQRELAMTARQIRTLATSGTAAETAHLLNKIAHPGVKQPLESLLAQTLPTELVWYARRGYKAINVPNLDWDYIFNCYGSKTLRMLVTTPISDISLPWTDIDASLGDWQCAIDRCDHFIAEGYYLCCDVHVVSDAGYIAALEGLFQQVKKQHLTLDTNGHLVEQVRRLMPTRGEGVIFSLQIPVFTPSSLRVKV